MNIKCIDTEILVKTRIVKTTVLFKDGSVHKTYYKIPFIIWIISDKDTLISIYHLFDCIEWGHTEVNL